jgi:hypothetical protein
LHDGYRANHGWFAHEYGESLEQLWPQFLKRWRDSSWQSVLQSSIWWFVGAASQAAGSDGSLILAQAGLELLAWVHVVEDQKIISRRGFEDLPTADKLRLFLSLLRVPNSFSPGQKAFEKLAIESQKSNVLFGAQLA